MTLPITARRAAGEAGGGVRFPDRGAGRRVRWAAGESATARASRHGAPWTERIARGPAPTGDCSVEGNALPALGGPPREIHGQW